ncbi:TetR/AcrR family transcriptional regulator [Novosphingobium beihaiensis]|uniref:TetR/AcrR family transcriptional regulator n=1 Tax=Novosphingobium beihaiensis TaxID=2930389 RepID=A0ABT0BRC5_9SPHN|nr:TetR/AcrR family transcriptional regulator [Novosphingobium beihaiensis]MCJ2187602.1 TetR/AcrR family transcriptional regulator [Novosphingobium beihaiensis]
MHTVDREMTGAEKAKPQDHRVRVAGERRERMRARLQDAILASCTANVDFSMPSVEDVCRTAGVSRATFYKHFDSVQDAVGTLGEVLLDEMVNSLAAMFDGDSALERITMGLQLFLMRSVTDPRWATFVSRVVQLDPDTDFARNVAKDLKAASDSGEISIANADAAISMALGSMFEAIRHLHKTGDRRREYVESLSVMILHGLGVPAERAASLVRKKSAQIRGLAPDFADWWKDPWI